MDHVDTPQSRCQAGLARADITPPVGTYHRLWGAALHDRSTAVHRPLLATALWLEPLTPEPGASDSRLLLALDHCLLDREDIDRIRQAAGPGQVHVTVSHTHGSGWMSRSRSHLPGGEFIGPYLDELVEVCGRLAQEARRNARAATVVYGTGRCSLAAHRDYRDNTGRFVCGFNPHGSADDTVLVARLTDSSGEVFGTVVNYACHPTTLAWENQAISPDYVGAMREVIEQHTQAPCLFLQGASGDLGPRQGFVGDVEIADRNGRQLGFAALSALEALPPPGTRHVYSGAVVSGATLGTWKHQPLDAVDLERQRLWQTRRFTVELPYRVDLPTLEGTRQQLAHWQAEEEKARAEQDGPRVRDCRARAEQMTRQLGRLKVLPAGRTYPFNATVWRLGDALWVLAPGELYHVFQTTLRARFPGQALVVVTLTDDWQPGYLPTAGSYGYGIYQEEIALVGPGCLEVLMEAVSREIRALQAS